MRGEVMAFLAMGRTTVLERFPMGAYTCVLHGDVESVGLIEYGHVLDVIDPASGKRVFAVAAERNQMARILGGGSHFLCGYDGGTHLNYGSSDDWAGREKFLERAKKLVCDKLGIPAEAPPAPARLSYGTPAEAPPARPILGGMALSLGGVLAVLALALIGHESALSYIPGLRTLLTTAAFAAFAAGCFLTALRLPRGVAAMLWPAGACGAGAALIALVQFAMRMTLSPELGHWLDFLPAQGLLMAGLFFHGLFLMALANSMGLRFGEGAAIRMLYAWLLFTGLYFYAHWRAGGPPAEWVGMVSLLGLGVWSIYQALVAASARAARRDMMGA